MFDIGTEDFPGPADFQSQSQKIAYCPLDSLRFGKTFMFNMD